MSLSVSSISTKEFTLKTPDGFKLNGVLNQNKKKKSFKLIIIVHGMTGNINEGIHALAARAFVPKGYDVIRFNLYDWEKGARRLRNCTLQTHADDLNLVINRFKKGYKKIYLIGHSYGGLTIMQAQPKGISAISLWDASLDTTRWLFDEKKLKKHGFTFVDWGVEVLIGKKMVKEHNNKYNLHYCLNLAKTIITPTQEVLAGKDPSDKRMERYVDVIPAPTEKIIVKDADHCFTPIGITEELYEHTHNWFKKW